MDYDLYLFSNLIKLFDSEFKQLPYDEQYDKLPTLYTDFENSEFNVDTKGAYDCMIDYFKNKKGVQDLIKNTHEKIRNILIAHGNEEFGDCIIDEISEAVGIPTTTVYYEEE